VALLGVGVIAPLALTGAATASPGSAGSNGAPPIHGTIKGFASGDFAFLDALSTKTLNLAQLSLAQSAAGVSNTSMQTTDTLGQSLLTTKSATGHNAFARGAGVSVNLGAADKANPKVQLVQAEAVSPPPNQVTTKRLLNLPLAPLATVDVQPDIAATNTRSNADFCVLGAPLSIGTGDVTNADVLPLTKAITVLAADGTVTNTSTEELDPNGAGGLGLNSVSLLNTAGITLFRGIPGAAITIKVINPLFLSAFAGGVPGSSKVVYGSNDGSKDVLSITAGGSTQKLTAEQLLGTDGVTIDVDGLLRVQIGGKPTITQTGDTQISALADLVSVQVISLTTPTVSSVGGPLGPLLNPILTPVLNALNALTTQLDKALTSLGITKGVDLRVGHFEANSEVPQGGVKCGLPVSKKTNKDPVTAGDSFTTTISADNPYDCVVRNLAVDDKITGTGGVTWTVDSTNPKADSASNSEVKWNNLGNLPPGGHKQVTVTITVGKDSTAGQMRDHAHVTGTCATGNGPGTANVSLGGNFTLHAPTINPASSPKGPLPTTGSSPWLPVGGGLLLMTGIGLAVARRRSSL
jgi:LPXTG-motif cell wall-anchored protein